MQEIRLDIDAKHKPDIVASITNMGDVGPFDAAYCSHCLEHLYPHDVPVALYEFNRVLRPGGTVVLIVPDLEGLEVSDRVLYVTDTGMEVTAFDMFYGHRRLIGANPYMAHHSGFTAPLLEQAMKEAGFESVRIKHAEKHHLIAVGTKATETA